MSASVVNQVRHLVVDGVGSTSAFVTPGAEGQTPEVRFGWKANWNARERVYTRDVVFSHEPANMRPTKTHRREEAGFDFVILVAGIGQDEETVSARALELGEAVEDWVAIHANWNGQVTGLNWLLIQGDGALTAAFNDNGVIVELTYPIRYNARLT